MEEEKRSYNLCSMYMLPLLGLNRQDFGLKTFVNSYVSENDKHIIVELVGPLSVVISNQPTFRFQFSKDGNTFAVFEIPKFYIPDVEKFKLGCYSLFSEQAKTLIRRVAQRSGLLYKQPIPGKKTTRTAVELLVLDKDEELRQHLESKLEVSIPQGTELGSIPGDDNFYELNLTTKLEPQNC